MIREFSSIPMKKRDFFLDITFAFGRPLDMCNEDFFGIYVDIYV